MPSYLSKPGFLIKGMGLSLRSSVRQQQLRKAEQLPGFKRPAGQESTRTQAPPSKRAAGKAAKK